MERPTVLPNPTVQKPSLECSSCGYGIASFAPPERCPMCQREGTWVDSPWGAFDRTPHLIG